MFQLLLPLLSPIISNLVDRIPDPAARQKAQEEAEAAIVKSVTDMQAAQMDVNKIEAGHASLFVAGWRPFIGWVCGIALAYHFIMQPLIAFTLTAVGHPVNLPVFDMDTLMTLLLGMLGLGTMRTVEKMGGVAKGMALKK